MVDRYYLAKLAITAMVEDENFIDPDPDGPLPSYQVVMPHALALADSLMEAFGMVKSDSAEQSEKP